MNLLRYHPVTKDLRLPNGRLVKVEVNETATIQQIHDWADRLHGTARPETINVKVRTGSLGRLRVDGVTTNGPKRFVQDDDLELWVPLKEGRT